MFQNINLSGLFALIILLQGCGGGGSSTVNPPPPPADKSTADFEVLLMGNSHTTPIPSMLEKIFAVGYPDKTTNFEVAPGYLFLIDRMNDSASINMLREGEWTHVILQALKYSSSGQYSYPTTGAEYFINQSKGIGATPILFPEHPRAGQSWEVDYLWNLHTSVADRTPACVAPIGYVWQEVMNQSSIALHSSDGNHASTAGSFLTALTIYSIITGDLVSELDEVPNVPVDSGTQELFKSSVDYILATFQPCSYLVN